MSIIIIIVVMREDTLFLTPRNMSIRGDGMQKEIGFGMQQRRRLLRSRSITHFRVCHFPVEQDVISYDETPGPHKLQEELVVIDVSALVGVCRAHPYDEGGDQVRQHWLYASSMYLEKQKALRERERERTHQHKG